MLRCGRDPFEVVNRIDLKIVFEYGFVAFWMGLDFTKQTRRLFDDKPFRFDIQRLIQP